MSNAPINPAAHRPSTFLNPESAQFYRSCENIRKVIATIIRKTNNKKSPSEEERNHLLSLFPFLVSVLGLPFSFLFLFFLT
jgi:hypothetical protein